MVKKFRDNMFYIGIFIFSLTVFFEHLLNIETHVTCFIKGLACGLELVGIIVLMKNNKKK